MRYDAIHTALLGILDLNTVQHEAYPKGKMKTYAGINEGWRLGRAERDAGLDRHLGGVRVRGAGESAHAAGLVTESEER
jgi:hypothetical protein